MLEAFPGFGCVGGKCLKNHPFVFCVPLGDDTFALRQSKCATYEAPVLYLLIGSHSGLLIDSGDLEEDGELLSHLDLLLGDKILIVVHTHPHSDHMRGDGMLEKRRKTTVVKHEIQEAEMDIGNRIVKICKAGSGHSAWDICFLDLKTKYLFVGDVLYPGFIYINDYELYKKGMISLWENVKGKYRYSFGAHCEMSRGGDLYKSGSRYQPNEAPIAQAPKVLDDLVALLKQPRSFIDQNFVLCANSKL